MSLGLHQEASLPKAEKEGRRIPPLSLPLATRCGAKPLKVDHRLHFLADFVSELRIRVGCLFGDALGSHMHLSPEKATVCAIGYMVWVGIKHRSQFDALLGSVFVSPMLRVSVRVSLTVGYHLPGVLSNRFGFGSFACTQN